MVSKSRKQRQVQKNKRISGNTEPVPISTGKSVHLKKTRPNMKAKMKIRLGHESSDIYTGFENSKRVQWQCPTCNHTSRVVGFCVACEAAKTNGVTREAKTASSSSNTAAAANSGVRTTKAAKMEKRK